MNYFYSLFRPGGNDTAMVHALVYDPKRRKQINDAIMMLHSSVEQVGFIGTEKGTRRLIMAGGEFCGNATRAAASYFLRGKTGATILHVSGVESPLAAGVVLPGTAWAAMPVSKPLSEAIKKVGDVVLVELDGITHVLRQTSRCFSNPEDAKISALSTLAELNLLQTRPAAGVMFFRKQGTKVVLEPVVWVRDIRTLFYETACASGTTAVGLFEAYRRGESIHLSIGQPSGLALSINVSVDKGGLVSACINGPIRVLRRNVVLHMADSEQ